MRRRMRKHAAADYLRTSTHRNGPSSGGKKKHDGNTRMQLQSPPVKGEKRGKKKGALVQRYTKALLRP
jgi:hypothetical protein